MNNAKKIYAYIEVLSSDKTLVELDERLGLNNSDQSYSKDDPARNGHINQYSSWQLKINLSDDGFPLQNLSLAIETLPKKLANNIATLISENTQAHFYLIQRVNLKERDFGNNL